MATQTRNPTSEDAVSGSWTGASRHLIVDDYPDTGGTDFTSGGTAASAITFGFSSAFTIPDNSTIQSVQVLYYDRKNAAQSNTIAARLKVGGNYYNNASTHNAANGTWTQRTDTWTQNPKTSANWTLQDINGGGSNDLQAFGINASDANPVIDISSIQVLVNYTAPSAIAGTADGTSTATASGRLLGRRSGTSDGTSTSSASGILKVRSGGTADGTSTASASIGGNGTIAGTSTGLSTASASIIGKTALSGTSDGSSTASASIIGKAIASAVSDGTSTAVASIIGISLNFQYYREIVIDNTKVYDDLTDFPVLISITNNSLKTVGNGGKVQSSSGYDIAFYAESDLDTQLKHEVDFWDGTTGEFIAWVKVPALADASDTVIYLAYGESSISAPTEDPENVYDSDYKLVYHLGDGSTLDATDSTSNGNDGTISGAVAQAGGIAGQADFDGNDDGIASGSLPTTNTTNITLSGIFEVSSFASEGVLLYNGDQGGDGYGFIIDPTTGLLRLLCGGVAVQNFNTSLSLNTRYHLTLTRDGSTWRMYVDGVEETNTYTDSPGTPSTYPFHIGDQQMRTANNAPMYVDEVRFSTVQRSAEWIKTEYYSQSDPATFYSLGSETATSGSISGSSTGTSTATANLIGKGYISGTSTGLSTANASIIGESSLSGTSDGLSTASASIGGKGYISGSSTGASTASASLVAKTGISGTADGTSTASASIVAKGYVSGNSTGSSTASANISGKGVISMSAAGTSTANASIVNVAARRRIFVIS